MEFKSDHVTLEDIKDAFQENATYLSNEARGRFSQLCAQSESSSDLFDRMKGELSFGNMEWGALARSLRDRQSSPLDKNQTLDVVEGGVMIQMTMKDLEEKFLEENPTLIASQKCVPEVLIHNDHSEALTNKEAVMHDLKGEYEKLCESKKTEMKLDNPNRRVEEIERQASKEALEEIKNTRAAQALKQRESLCAEDSVQKSILRAAKTLGIPVHIFRGVNSYQHVGQFLEAFGIPCSRLKSFQALNQRSSKECENDILAVALPSSGPVVTFVQVIVLSYQRPHKW